MYQTAQAAEAGVSLLKFYFCHMLILHAASVAQPVPQPNPKVFNYLVGVGCMAGCIITLFDNFKFILEEGLERSSAHALNNDPDMYTTV